MEVYATKTWFDRHLGVVEVEDDVQNVVRDLKAISDRLHVYYNPQSGGFDVVERCLDGVERLVKSVKAEDFDQRLVHSVRLSDHWHGEETPNNVLSDDEDFLAKLEQHNEQLELDLHEKGMDKVRDAGLRYAWAMDMLKDHNSPGGQILVPRDVDG